MTFRDFDVFLSSMKKPQSQLTKALKNVNEDYDIIILDCPPNISSLSENIFRAADRIIIPVIPTTLSERTLEQLIKFFDENKIDSKKMMPFFSMVQRQKKMHIETMGRLKVVYPKMFLNEPIPFSTDIELMGVHRAPVATFAKSRPATSAYNALWTELVVRI
jgi:chromosome partitioning protein